MRVCTPHRACIAFGARAWAGPSLCFVSIFSFSVLTDSIMIDSGSDCFQISIRASGATTSLLTYISRFCCCNRGVLNAINRAYSFWSKNNKNNSILFSLLRFSLAYTLQPRKLYFLLNFNWVYINFSGDWSFSEQRSWLMLEPGAVTFQGPLLLVDNDCFNTQAIRRVLIL